MQNDKTEIDRTESEVNVEQQVSPAKGRTVAITFINECAVDGCYKKKLKDFYLCKQHKQELLNRKELTVYYGKKIQIGKNICKDCGKICKPKEGIVCNRCYSQYTPAMLAELEG